MQHDWQQLIDTMIDHRAPITLADLAQALQTPALKKVETLGGLVITIRVDSAEGEASLRALEQSVASLKRSQRLAKFLARERAAARRRRRARSKQQAPQSDPDIIGYYYR